MEFPGSRRSSRGDRQKPGRLSDRARDSSGSILGKTARFRRSPSWTIFRDLELHQKLVTKTAHLLFLLCFFFFLLCILGRIALSSYPCCKVGRISDFMKTGPLSIFSPRPGSFRIFPVKPFVRFRPGSHRRAPEAVEVLCGASRIQPAFSRDARCIERRCSSDGPGLGFGM